MKSLNYWQQFVQTGSVEDYLFYARAGEEQEEMQEEAGARQDAGIHICNRHDFEADSCR